MRKSILPLFFMALLIGGCLMPMPVTPKFEKNEMDVYKTLQAMDSFETASVNYSAISNGRKTTDLLIVQLVNGKTINGDMKKMSKVGLDAMKLVVNSISNENQYEKFQVVFVLQVKNGVITQSFTKPFEFTLNDLK